MPNSFNQHAIDEFRAGGRVGGSFERAARLLPTTRGAGTGHPHTTPLGRLADFLGRTMRIATAGGAPRQPQWYVNLLADPAVLAKDGTQTWTAHPVVLEEADRDVALAHRAAHRPGWRSYQEQTNRTLPVIVLDCR